MTWKEVEIEIRKKFKKRWKRWYAHSPIRVYVDIDTADLLEWGHFLIEKVSARFITASAMDTPRNEIEILYHFAFYGLPQVLSLRVCVPKEKLEIESMARILKGAEWIEREMAELFGIRFIGHPNPKRLLLPEDWPEGKYPLRRDP